MQDPPPPRFKDLEYSKINNQVRVSIHLPSREASSAEAVAPQITTLARVTIRGGSVAELSEWVKLRVSRMNALLTIYHDVGSLRSSHISFIYPQASVLLQCFGLRLAAKWSAATVDVSSKCIYQSVLNKVRRFRKYRRHLYLFHKVSIPTASHNGS